MEMFHNLNAPDYGRYPWKPVFGILIYCGPVIACLMQEGGLRKPCGSPRPLCCVCASRLRVSLKLLVKLDTRWDTWFVWVCFDNPVLHSSTHYFPGLLYLTIAFWLFLTKSSKAQWTLQHLLHIPLMKTIICFFS